MLQRVSIRPRPNWKRIVQDQGLTFHTDPNGDPYWREDAYYLFLEREVDEIDDATHALHDLCLQAVEHVVRNRLYNRLRIPPHMVPAIENSWAARDPSLYGRFDLVVDGINPPKMLEYNADTPTSLLEASVIQHFWREEVFPSTDQFNFIHETLVERMRAIAAERKLKRLHFLCIQENAEDLLNTSYLMDVWAEAMGGPKGGDPQQLATLLDISELGFNLQDGTIRDARTEEFIAGLFKLYPWEWLARDQFDVSPDPHLWMQVRNWSTVLEPAWKMILSNKGILPILWELFPGHPNLLASYADQPGPLQDFVRKPFYSREGANVAIVTGGQTRLHTGGEYGAEGFVFQQLAPIPECSGHYPVVGSWVVGDTPCGMGIRESRSPITDNLSSFVPHIFG